MSVSNPSYRPDIDGLRAVAVIAVLANHINSDLFRGGYFGVDVFFAISGYVITASLVNKPDSISSFGHSVLNFYRRRMRRLYPALLVVTCAGFLLSSLFSSNPLFSINTGLFSLFGLSNFYLLKNNIQYFAESASLNFFTHTWSLGVEFQFYCIYPLIFFGLTGHPKKSGICLQHYLVVLAVTLLSMGCNIFLIFNSPESAFYLPFGRVWEFGFGILAFSLNINNIRIPAKSSILELASFILSAISLMSLFALLIAGCNSNLIGSIIAATTASLLMILNKSKGSITNKILSINFLLDVGKKSYSIYLWHWPLIVLARLSVGIDLITAIIIISVTYIIGRFSYQYIESTRFNQYSNMHNWFIGGAAVVLAGLILRNNPHAIYQGNIKNESLAATSRPPIEPHYSYLKSDRLSSTHLIILGDSHAGHLYDMAKQLNYANGLTYEIYAETVEDAGLINHMMNFFLKSKKHQGGANLYTIYSESIKNAAIAKRKLVVLISTRRTNNITPGFKSSLSEIAQDASSRNIPVVIFGQGPEFQNDNISMCFTYWFRPIRRIKNCTLYVARAKQIQSFSHINSFYQAIARDYSNVYFFDVLSLLCPRKNRYCSNAGQFGYILSDSNHFTRETSKRLSIPFWNFMQSNRL